MHGSVAKSQLLTSRGDAGPWSFWIAILAVAGTIYAAALIVTAVDDAGVLAPADRIERDALRLEQLYRPQPWLVVARAICCERPGLSDGDRSLLFCDRLASAIRHPDVDAREYPQVDQFTGRRYLWHWRVRREFRVPPREAAAMCHGLFEVETAGWSRPSPEPQGGLASAD